MMKIAWMVAALFSLATTGPAAAAEDESGNVARIAAMVQQQKPAEAVKLADEAIARIEARIERKPDTSYVCATGGPQMLLTLISGVAAQDKAGGPKRDIVAIDNNLCDARFLKGYALIDLGRGDLAADEFKIVTQMAPFNAHYLNEYAELFKARREWQKSYDMFSRAWDVVDRNKKGSDATIAARSLRGMGYNKIELGDLAEAEKLFRQSLEYEPDSHAAESELQYIARKKAIGG